MILTPLISGQTARLYELRRQLFQHAPIETLDIPEQGLSQHAVIVGGGWEGAQTAAALRRFGIPLVIVELDHQQIQRAKADGFPVVYGDATHDIVLDATEIHAARLLVVTTPDMGTAQTIISKARSRNEKLNVVARTSDMAFLPFFRDLGCSSVVLPEFETSLEITRESLLYFSIPLMDIQNHMESQRRDLFAPIFNEGRSYKTLVQLRAAEREFDLHWLTLPPQSSFDGRSIGSLGIRTKTGASVVGVVRDEKLISNPGADFEFKTDDLIAVIGTDEAYRSFQSMIMPEEAAALA